MLLLSLALSLTLTQAPAGSSLPSESARLMFLDKAGHGKPVSPQGLALADPRTRGAWSIRPLGFPAPSADEIAQAAPRLELQLASGDSLTGWLAPSTGETLGLRLLGGVQIPILIDHIVRIEVLGDKRVPQAQDLVRPQEGDRLYRRTGAELDAIDGTFESFEAGGVRFESQAMGLQSFGWSEIAALMIEDLGAEQPASEPGKLPVILDLVGGGSLRAELLQVEEQGCRLRLAGEEQLFGWGIVEELLVNDGSVVFLSDLPALKEEGRGQVFGDEFEVTWPHAINRSVWKQGPLRCAERVYRRGIGTHAPTRVSWTVPAGSMSLRGAVGIDDSALYNEPEFRGSVVFRVLLDGKTGWESPLMGGGSEVLEMPALDLEGVRLVTLEADMAGRYEGDRANWLGFAFVR